MTQMMLFDSSSLATTTVPVVSSPNAVASTPTRSSAGSGDDGIHRMGDLARLVLLRYQLVAQRRQQAQQSVAKGNR